MTVARAIPGPYRGDGWTTSVVIEPQENMRYEFILTEAEAATLLGDLADRLEALVV